MPTTDDGATARRRANIVARIAALIVALGGLALVVAPVFTHPSSRRALFGDPFTSGRVTVVVEKRAADGTVSVETTTSPDDGSFIERSLAESGVLLLRIGVAAAAAFLAGAVVQRTMLGHFALELGPLKVPDLPAAEAAEASRDALEALKDRLVRQEKAIQRGIASTERAVAAMDARITELQAALDARDEPQPAVAPVGRARAKVTPAPADRGSPKAAPQPRKTQ